MKNSNQISFWELRGMLKQSQKWKRKDSGMLLSRFVSADFNLEFYTETHLTFRSINSPKVRYYAGLFDWIWIKFLVKKLEKEID